MNDIGASALESQSHKPDPGFERGAAIKRKDQLQFAPEFGILIIRKRVALAREVKLAKTNTHGRLISIAGTPGAGKTFLAEKLAPYFEAEIIYEHPPEGFPHDIRNSFTSQSGLFETIVWFRNRQVANYVYAKTIVETGKNVVMDVPHYHNQMFIHPYVPNPFLRDILSTMGDIDRYQYGYPDCTIFIATTPSLVREFLNRRAGSRQWEKDEWFEFLTTLPRFADAYMSSIRTEIPAFVELQRSDHDFALKKDLVSLIDTIHSLL